MEVFEGTEGRKAQFRLTILGNTAQERHGGQSKRQLAHFTCHQEGESHGYYSVHFVIFLLSRIPTLQIMLLSLRMGLPTLWNPDRHA